MAGPGRNEGFHVLDDFVCEAIHAPSIPLARPTNQGRNKGMSVVEELVFMAGPKATSDEPNYPDRYRLPLSPEQHAAFKAVIEPLATYISASSNPRGALVHFMELLSAELHSIDRVAAEWLGQLRHPSQPADPGAAHDPRLKASEG